MIEVEVSWPAQALRPNNGFGNRWAHATAFKKAKEEAYWATKYVKPLDWVAPETGDIILKQVAHPPDKRERDRDNVDSGLKAARDGIASALGVNDRRFRPMGIEWGEPKKGGVIVITVVA